MRRPHVHNQLFAKQILSGVGVQMSRDPTGCVGLLKVNGGSGHVALGRIRRSAYGWVRATGKCGKSIL
jgi:hypothetical protein